MSGLHFYFHSVLTTSLVPEHVPTLPLPRQHFNNHPFLGVNTRSHGHHFPINILQLFPFLVSMCCVSLYVKMSLLWQDRHQVANGSAKVRHFNAKTVHTFKGFTLFLHRKRRVAVSYTTLHNTTQHYTPPWQRRHHPCLQVVCTPSLHRHRYATTTT